VATNIAKLKLTMKFIKPISRMPKTVMPMVDQLMCGPIAATAKPKFPEAKVMWRMSIGKPKM
jgi:hypothetical protein